MLREMEDVRFKEQAGAKKLDLETQGLRILESRLNESLEALQNRERDVSIREKETEDKHRDSLRIAREESFSQLRSELEASGRERNALKAERERFDLEIRAHSDIIGAAADVHKRLREAQGMSSLSPLDDLNIQTNIFLFYDMIVFYIMDFYFI